MFQHDLLHVQHLQQAYLKAVRMCVGGSVGWGGSLPQSTAWIVGGRGGGRGATFDASKVCTFQAVPQARMQPGRHKPGYSLAAVLGCGRIARCWLWEGRVCGLREQGQCVAYTHGMAWHASRVPHSGHT